MTRAWLALFAWPIGALAILAGLVWQAWEGTAPPILTTWAIAPPAYTVRLPSGEVLRSNPDRESWDALSAALAMPGADVLQCDVQVVFVPFPPILEWIVERRMNVRVTVLKGTWTAQEQRHAADEALPWFGLDGRYAGGAVVLERTVGWSRIRGHLAITLLIPALPLLPRLALRRSRRALRAIRGVCPACAYDWRGLDHCPECGAPRPTPVL